MGVEEQTQRVLVRFQKRAASQLEEISGASQKRDIPKGHPYDPKALKPLSKSLFATSVALGHVLAAYKHFSQVKSPAVSPDGRIGGRGYIMSMNEVRRKLWEASEALSAISDALHDEINAPHWKPKLALLDDNDREDVSRFVEEAQEVLDKPGEQAEEEIEEIDKENDEAQGSQVPTGGNAPVKKCGQLGPLDQIKTAATTLRQQLEDAAKNIDPDRLAEVLLQSYKGGGTDSQTGGPRVDDRDPGAGDGPFNSFNPPEDATSDDWGLNDGSHSNEYDFTSEWENNMREASRLCNHWQYDPRAESAMPSDQDMSTKGRDFGIGYGAKGEAEESIGEWSPHAGLPGVPWQAVGDTAPEVDTALNDRRSFNELKVLFGEGMLPGDESEPVARADYYRGDRGNLVNVQGTAPHDEELDDVIDTGYIYEDLDTTRLPLGEPGLDER